MTDDSAIEYYENIPTAIEWKDCKIISQGRIGRVSLIEENASIDCLINIDFLIGELW